MRKFILLAVVMFSANFALAQNSNVLNKAKSYLKQQQQVLGFSSTDFEDLSVQTNYTDEKFRLNMHTFNKISVAIRFMELLQISLLKTVKLYTWLRLSTNKFIRKLATKL